MRKPAGRDSTLQRGVSFGAAAAEAMIPSDSKAPSWASSVAHCGWLYKRGAGYRPTSSAMTGQKKKTIGQMLQKVKGTKEKARYFVLTTADLLYFPAVPGQIEEVTEKTECRGGVDLHEVTAILTFADEPTSFALQTPARTYHFRAENAEIKMMWVNKLQQQVDAFSAPASAGGDGAADGDADERSSSMVKEGMLKSSPFESTTPAECVTRAMKHSIRRARSSSASDGATPRASTSTAHPSLDAIGEAECADEAFTSNAEGTEPGLISTFAPGVFGALRSHWGCTDRAFEHSLCYQTLTAAGGGAGRSGSLFFFSWDQHFVTKSITKQEVLVLQAMLLEYVQHVNKYPNTMLPRFLSLVQVQISAKQAIYAVTMTNVFDTPLPLHHKFDMKGSSVGRHTKEEAAEESISVEGSVPTLKDINFTQGNLQMHLTPTTRDALRAQIEVDTALLLGYNIMDYSLLLGVHDSATRRKRAASAIEARKSGTSTVNPLDAALVEGSADESEEIDLDALPETAGDAYLTPNRWMNCYGGMRVPELETGETGETLRLETVDAELRGSNVYYVAIIDTLQTYNTIKKMERFAKTLKIKTLAGITRKQANTDISSMDAITYRMRFLSFLTDSVAPDPLTIRLVDAAQWTFYKAVLAHESQVRQIMEERGLIDREGAPRGSRLSGATPALQLTAAAAAAPGGGRHPNGRMAREKSVSDFPEMSNPSTNPNESVVHLL